MKKLRTPLTTSLWVIPALFTGLAIALAFTTVWIDRQNLRGGARVWFLFAAGAEGARGVLSTIAGSIITVTGVVFSITVVVLQLASSQFTPRVLRTFTQDRVTQVVLGVFIGTFTYALLVLRTVRSQLEDYDRFVPLVSVTVSILLAVLSVGFFIYFVHHITRSIRAEVIIDRVTRDALRTIRAVLPERTTVAASGPPTEPLLDQRGPAAPLHFRRSGYLRHVDETEALRIAEQHDLQVRIEKRIGDFVLESEPVLMVWPGHVRADVLHRLRNTLEVGPERTGELDVGRGLIELSDIAVRALSPGINDPTTAIVCIERLTELMTELAAREFAPVLRLRKNGRVGFFLRQTSFDELVQLSYARLRQYGSKHPAVALRLVQSLGALLDRAPLECRDTLEQQLRAVLEDARRDVTSTTDTVRIERAAHAFLSKAHSESQDPC